MNMARRSFEEDVKAIPQAVKDNKVLAIGGVGSLGLMAKGSWHHIHGTAALHRLIAKDNEGALSAKFNKLEGMHSAKHANTLANSNYLSGRGKVAKHADNTRRKYENIAKITKNASTKARAEAMVDFADFTSHAMKKTKYKALGYGTAGATMLYGAGKAVHNKLKRSYPLDE